MEFQWDKQTTQPALAKVTVEQGVPRVMHLLVVLVAISIVPIAVAIHHHSFEVRRWQDSDFSPYATDEEG